MHDCTCHRLPQLLMKTSAYFIMHFALFTCHSPIPSPVIAVPGSFPYHTTKFNLVYQTISPRERVGSGDETNRPQASTMHKQQCWADEYGARLVCLSLQRGRSYGWLAAPLKPSCLCSRGHTLPPFCPPVCVCMCTVIYWRCTVIYWRCTVMYWRCTVIYWRCTVMYWRCTVIYWRCTVMYWRCTVIYWRCTVMYWRCTVIYWRCTVMYWRCTVIYWRCTVIYWRCTVIYWRCTVIYWRCVL